MTTPGQVAAGWTAAMHAGDWEAAWRHTDLLERPRREAQARPGFERQPWHLVWDGSPLSDRSVLVRCEHGLGDTLQFSRFLPALAQQAREAHVMAQPHLLRLLRAVPGIGTVHDGWAGPDWPAHELEVEVMELAYAMRVTARTVPPPLPLAEHVHPLPGVREREDRRLHVGLLWAASNWDHSRSLPLAELLPLLDMPGLRLFALQQGPAALDPIAAGWPLEPLWQRTDAIEDAAHAMLAMDVVVCVDGMPAHLAASLGRPTWLLLQHEADWRWGGDPARTPWYPAMRLFRQDEPGDWQGVIARVAGGLQDLQGAPTASGDAGRPAARATASTVAG
ncbi:hypothetical protein [Ramlibacter algicola]|uniref:ADP-heptose--LPS heptosyltransferase n=1 Tax=Ramlibacter algicola TaxID=2795217 RepID=A0A934UST3_9BURK|nr:hypothetical protein [Ramlibacter algicola]MBK0394058.1 hypothetical protein [Ramlibacter algicola]